MRRDRRRLVIGLTLLAINGTIIGWRVASDRPPPEVVPVAVAAPAPPAAASPPACLAAADRPYFGLLAYRPPLEGISLAAVDGSLVDVLDHLCGCPADEIGGPEPGREEATAVAMRRGIIPPPDFSGSVVPALLLADGRGDVGMPPISPPGNGPARPSDYPQPRPLESSERTSPDAPARPAAGPSAPPSSGECAFPGAAPSFPWDGAPCGPPCYCAPRRTLLGRFRAWLHHSSYKTCPWEGCCVYADPCCGAWPGPSCAPWGCMTCAEPGDCSSQGHRWFGFLHRRHAPVCVYPEPWGNCSPFPGLCDGGMSR
jgi:hypothetical protein